MNGVVILGSMQNLLVGHLARWLEHAPRLERPRTQAEREARDFIGQYAGDQLLGLGEGGHMQPRRELDEREVMHVAACMDVIPEVAVKWLELVERLPPTAQGSLCRLPRCYTAPINVGRVPRADRS